MKIYRQLYKLLTDIGSNSTLGFDPGRVVLDPRRNNLATQQGGFSSNSRLLNTWCSLPSHLVADLWLITAHFARDGANEGRELFSAGVRTFLDEGFFYENV